MNSEIIIIIIIFIIIIIIITIIINIIVIIIIIIVGSFEQSPSIGEVYGNWPDHSHPARGEVAEDELRETLADAMIESPTKEGGPASRGITCGEWHSLTLQNYCLFYARA